MTMILLKIYEFFIISIFRIEIFAEITIFGCAGPYSKKDEALSFVYVSFDSFEKFSF